MVDNGSGDNGGKSTRAPYEDTFHALPHPIDDYLGLDPNTEANFSWVLFDPRPALNALTPWLRPLRFGVYGVPLFLVAALFTIKSHTIQFVHDMRVLYSVVQLIEHMAFSMVTIDVLTQLALACAAHHYGAIVNEVSITIYFGFLPRFRVRANHTEKLPRRAQLWVHSAPLLTRFVLLSFGVLTWYRTRVFSPALANIGLGLFMVCMVDLIFASGNPFAKGSGYKILTALFRRPNLRGDAFTALQNLWAGRNNTAVGAGALSLYAGAVIVYMFILVIFVLDMVSSGLIKMSIGNSAIILTAALGFYLFNGQVSRLRKIGDASRRRQHFERWNNRVGRVVTALPAMPVDKPAAASGWKHTVVLTMLIVLILPYPYEPGGTLIIYPLQQMQVAPDVTGTVEEIFFDGGEFVRKGTPIARLRDDDSEAKVKIYNAEIQAQQDLVDNLKTLPKPEAIEVAQTALQTAITHEAYSREKVPRYQSLYNKGAISFDEFDKINKEHAVDVDQVSQKRAVLALVKTGPTADKIAAAEAELESLKKERDSYADKVARSILYMPIDGTITTLHLKQKINSFLHKGELFASVEDDSRVTAEIDVPESDIGSVEPGQQLRARPDAYFDHDFEGRVNTIDDGVTPEPSGNIVKVTGIIENPDGRLRAGMSGYAKIEGISAPVWKAFSMQLIRFFNIDVWSWIP